jgi:hypothetical protein
MRKKDVVFSQDEFDNAGRIDRLYMAMIQPDDFVLSHNEQEHFNILTRAYPIICTGRPPHIVIAQISALEDKWSSQAFKVYKESQDLYGRFEEVNTRVMRGIFINKMTKLAQMMEDIAESKAQYQSDNANYQEDEEQVLNVGTEVRIKASKEARECWEAIAKYTKIDKVDDVIDTTPPPPAPLLRVHEMYKKIEKAQIIDDGDTDDY